MTDLPRPTIFALSSGRGPAAIAVVRISGSRAGEALTALGVKTPEPRKAGLARIRDPQSGEIIDEGLVLFFPGPRSETGEDVAELQLHGGRAVVAATLAALGRLEGLRMAEPGEFTRRAFENGKLDLTAVEGLADLVSAETEGQRRQAFRQMKGALGQRAESWRERLIRALALVEARIDFSDEADVPEDLVAPALAIVRELEEEIGAVLADGGRGERLREGLVVAIAGPPNAGKSTLLNRIARREAAIVSPYAGTTRDVIEVHLDLDGWPVTLLDTAGIRETDDPVEMEGVRRARERAAAADLVLWVEDASTAPIDPAADVIPAAVTAGAAAPARRPARWLVRNKTDLVGPEADEGTPEGRKATPAASDRAKAHAGAPEAAPDQASTHAGVAGTASHPPPLPSPPAGKSSEFGYLYRVNHNYDNEPILYSFEYEFSLSAATGAGLGPLLAALTRHASEFLAGTEAALVTRARHRMALTETETALNRALSLADREDLLAEELRSAAAALGRLTGRVDVEDVLDVIFRDFCIGK